METAHARQAGDRRPPLARRPRGKRRPGMNVPVVACLVFAGLATASLGCLLFYERLPERHRQDDTQGVVRLVANIFVVMTSLVLGLMINSAKTRFDGINRDVHSYATGLILLERSLLVYGAAAEPAHARLHAYAERAANGRWTSTDPVLVSDRTSEELLRAIGVEIRAIRSAEADRMALWNDIWQQYRRIVELRWALIEQAEGSIPVPLLVMLVAWLVLIFASFGYRAPRNPVIVLSLVLSAALVAAALHLILDMDAPFEGSIQVSPAPLQRALAEMRR
jgi:hypothetical protein